MPLVKNVKHLDAMEEAELRHDDSGWGDEGQGQVGGMVTSASSFTGEATSTMHTKCWSMTSHAGVEGAGVAVGGADPLSSASSLRCGLQKKLAFGIQTPERVGAAVWHGRELGPL